MKNLKQTSIPGVYEIEMFHAGDERGSFTKPFHKQMLENQGLNGDFRESYFSVSSAGVIRGMHFQLPPHDHQKLVYCNSGALLDVVLDLRRGSPTYGQSASFELSGENHKALYIPTGLAHGFKVLKDNTMMTYLTGTEHAPNHDAGIHYNSFGFDWSEPNPVLSARDAGFPPLADFESPFTFNPKKS